MRLEQIGQHLRYAFRAMRRDPAFTTVAVLSLALGIGATTAVFSVADRILFRNPPYPHAERLVSLGIAIPQVPHEFLFGAMYADARRDHGVFEAMTSWTGTRDCDISDRGAVNLTCATVESNFLDTLEIRPALGRGFLAPEDQESAPKVAILSNAVWRTRFGGDDSIVGKTITLDGRPTRIVGVLPPGFEMPTLVRADVLVPQGLDEAAMRRNVNGRPLWIIARMRPGLTLREARVAFEPAFQLALGGVPPPMRKQVRFRVRSLLDRQTEDARLGSWVLLGSVIAVLLIACANVAGLLLARSITRRRESAIRAALGAGRGRMIAQALSESFLLAAFGMVVGIGLSYGLLRLFVRLAPEGILRLGDAGLDARVLVFTCACAVVTAVLLALGPALQGVKPEWLSASRIMGGSRGAVRQLLVATQIAITLVLVTGAGLLAKTLWNMETSGVARQSETVVTGSFVIPREYMKGPEQQLRSFEELESRLRALPGTIAVAMADSLPPAATARSIPFWAIQAEGQPPLSGSNGRLVVWRAITPDYFRALAVPVIQGRAFREEDRSTNAAGIVLSESLAHMLFGGQNAVGQRVHWGSWFQVVGVVRDVRNGGPTTVDSPEFYLLRSHSANQFIYNFPDALRRVNVVIRSAIRPQALASLIPPDVTGAETIEERVANEATRPRFNAVLLAMFAGFSLLLASVGLYGTISFWIAQTTREIGIRMALGATRAAIVRMIAERTGLWVGGGIAAGVAASLASARVLRTMLYGVSATDPLIIGGCIAVIGIVGVVAAAAPSRRAASVDPAVALRSE